MCVDMELAGALTRGMTVADRRVTAVARQNADVCLGVDVERFNNIFVAAFTSGSR
jgi:inosine-uridine nucleoside N-ribohydrolase